MRCGGQEGGGVFLHSSFLQAGEQHRVMPEPRHTHMALSPGLEVFSCDLRSQGMLDPEYSVINAREPRSGAVGAFGAQSGQKAVSLQENQNLSTRGR